MELYTIEKLKDWYEDGKEEALRFVDGRFSSGLIWIIYHILVIAIPIIILLITYDIFNWKGLVVILVIWILIEVITQFGEKVSGKYS